MKWKIYECEVRTTNSGKELKKLVLQGEGKQYPDKNVTCWPDNPLYPSLEVGQTIEAEMKVEDSNVQNPKGGYYKNKTLLKPGQLPTPPRAPETGKFDARAVNRLEHEVMPYLQKMMAKIDRIEAFVTGEVATYEKGEALAARQVNEKMEEEVKKAFEWAGEWDGQMPDFGEDETNKPPF